MSNESDVIYLYDASLEGFLTCVYESVYSREMPVDIMCADDAEPTMYLQRYVETDADKAARVYASIAKKISREAQELVNAVFLSCAENKEIIILRFLKLGYARGVQVMYLLSNPDVAPMYNAERAIKNEAHQFIQFLRFSDYGKVLAAVIHPKSFVLPYMQMHFVKRFICEDFIIYDETHKAALVYYHGRGEIVSLDKLKLPQVPFEEEKYRDMWQKFYNTIAIEARINPKCRMTHCPKRYWSDMLEMRPELNKSLRTIADENALKAASEKASDENALMIASAAG